MESTGSAPLYRPEHPVRFVTATALFDGHDVAINVIRRVLQRQGAEVIHLGHNRSVDEVVRAALDEDVQGIAVSSYQGGHVEYFKYLIDHLGALGRRDIKVYGGGGGVIVPDEIAELEAYGVAHIFSVEEGQRLGLDQMVNLLIRECDTDLLATAPLPSAEAVLAGDRSALARTITALLAGGAAVPFAVLAEAAERSRVPVLGVTGTGGAGKSSLTDELIRYLRLDLADKLRIAVIAIDPSRRRTGGALLADRLRMNAIASDQLYFRSLATRDAARELPVELPAVVTACKAAGYDLVIVETPGIGQGDDAVTEVADLSMYVMTPEYGAATQLEKIEMLDVADLVVINKSDRAGAEDAMRAVRRQWARSRAGAEPAVFATIASHFNDPGLRALYHDLKGRLGRLGLAIEGATLRPPEPGGARRAGAAVPAARRNYLAEIATTVRAYHDHTAAQAAAARRAQQLRAVAELLDAPDRGVVEALQPRADAALTDETERLLAEWPATRAAYAGEHAVADRVSLSGTVVPRVALPAYADDGELVRFLRSENLPGRFPFTAGVFAFKRRDEETARMFAGEGDPQRTNRRLHLLAAGQPATRLSIAFDPVTLYGRDPDPRPDIYGKIGTSGVSIASLEDMQELFSGFDLSDSSTSVSMTINGPAPAVLAMFLNTAIDQRLERFAREEGRPPTEAEAEQLAAEVLRQLRGTVQADILKEDQGQNTCIFSTDFSLGVMADIEQFFIEHEMENFYSVSISGYHIAEAGANPITQLAFTLANGFTYVESYLARGMAVDDFAPNLSFFFSIGMDPEYSVIGRVARRIWAIALRDRYGAGERAQKLKYHMQTSGRSLHAQEMTFNDIRTTLEALGAIADNANSLHTNAYDEAVTTPTEDSVRKALAIQLIINHELGLAMNENPLQGSFIIECLTEMVEEAVLAELERLSERGGVLGAMETGYQRGRIQDDSLVYEEKKHDGSLPIVGVNTFVHDGTEPERRLELARSTEEEKKRQLCRIAAFRAEHAEESERALARLREVALSGGNVFTELMSTVRHASLGEISEALFEVGGSYRRSA